MISVSARLPSSLSALSLLLLSHVTHASCVEHECELTPTLPSCDEVDDESWPGGQLFTFTGRCVISCDTDDSERATLEELTLDTLEILDVSESEPRRVEGRFTELERTCGHDRLIRFDQQLSPASSYLVRWNNRQMAYFVVMSPPVEVLEEAAAEPQLAPRREPQTRLGRRHPHWDSNRQGLGWAVSAAGSLYLTAPPDGELLILLGGTISFGMRHLREFNTRGLFRHSERLAGLAPLISLVLPAVFLLPVGAIIGNDVGVDLTINVHAPANPQEPGLWIALGLRPYFRVSRDAMIHSGSTLDLLVPEVGVEWVSDHLQSFYAIWTFLPVSFRFRDHFAFSIDPVRAGINVDLDDGTITSRFQIALSAQFL